MYHNIVTTKVIGEIIATHNINTQPIAQLAAQQTRQLHTAYIFVLRNMAACLSNEHMRCGRQGKESLCAIAKYTDKKEI